MWLVPLWLVHVGLVLFSSGMGRLYQVGLDVVSLGMVRCG